MLKVVTTSKETIASRIFYGLLYRYRSLLIVARAKELLSFDSGIT